MRYKLEVFVVFVIVKAGAPNVVNFSLRKANSNCLLASTQCYTSMKLCKVREKYIFKEMYNYLNLHTYYDYVSPHKVV